MSQTLEAIFDGKTLQPMIPLNLKPGTRVSIIIENVEATETENSTSFLQTAKSLNLEGDPEWSENFDQYLYND